MTLSLLFSPSTSFALFFIASALASMLYSTTDIGDVVPEERLPSTDSGPRRVLERRTIPRTRTSAIYPGDNLNLFIGYYVCVHVCVCLSIVTSASSLDTDCRAAPGPLPLRLSAPGYNSRLLNQ